MACVSCHKSKVKCDRNNPCSRCSRLGILCMPHVSQQGKSVGKKKNETKKRPIVAAQQLTTENAFVRNAASIQDSHVGTTIYHFGLNHIVRQWMSLAVTRRSFQLQEVACRLANKVGISMDQIMCGKGLPQEWKVSDTETQRDLGLQFVANAICQPAEVQNMGLHPLTQPEIPVELFQRMRCCPDSDGCGGGIPCPVLVDLKSRWILIRECRGGQARFFTSDAFARDIVPAETLQQTWIDNQVEVKSLFMPKEKNNELYDQAFVHQVALNHSPNVILAPDRVTGITIRLSSKELVQVDFICAYHIRSLDHSFMINEFIPRSTKPRGCGTTTVASNEEDQEGAADVELMDFGVSFQDLPEYVGPSNDDEYENSIWEWLMNLEQE